MSFLAKFKIKNPIDQDTTRRISEKVTKILEVFGKNYAKQTILQIVKNKEDDVEKKEIRNAIVKKDKENKAKYYKKKYGEESDVPNFPEIPEKGTSLEIMTDYCRKMLDLGFKPLFPRGKMEPLKPPELRAKLSRWTLRDEDSDPYAVYILECSKGKLSVEKERRYKEFEKLNKALKKILPPTAALPPPSSKFGSRNLTKEFLDKRLIDLNTYLEEIMKVPEIVENEAFQKFIGIFPRNELDDQIFEAAFKRTKWYFWCWGDFKYDEPGEALAKLMTIEIWRTIRYDVESKLPNEEGPRKFAKKLAFKAISGVINPAVPPGWEAAYSASKPVRDRITSALDTVIGIIIEKKHELNNKLKEKMLENFGSIKEAIGKVFTSGIHLVVPPIVEQFSFIYKTYQEKAEPLILEGIKDGDKKKVEDGVQKMCDIYEKVIAKLYEKIDEQLTTVSEKLGAEISLSFLKEMFFPLKALGRIISDMIKIINPQRWRKVVDEVLDYKQKLYDCNGENVDKILYDMERSAFYRIGWETYYMDNARYWLRYDIYRLNLGLDSLGEICFDLGKKLIKKVYKQSCKKFVRKFSDYVWGFSIKKEDDKSWKEKVDEALNLAYQAAKHKFNKECGNIVKEGVCDIIEGVILNKVIEEINKMIESFIKTLSDAIPDNIKEMVDVEEMAKNDIEEVLTNTFEGAVDDQEEPFSEELTKAIEKCQLES